jgi:hypothetical protein
MRIMVVKDRGRIMWYMSLANRGLEELGVELGRGGGRNMIASGMLGPL